MHSSFKGQVKALMWRNCLIKRNNCYQIFLELMPLLTLAVFYNAKFPVHGSSTVLDFSFNSVTLPDDIQICAASSDSSNPVLSTLKRSLKLHIRKSFKFKIVKNEILLERYLKINENVENPCHIGIFFPANATSSGSYVIKIPEARDMTNSVFHLLGKHCSPSQKYDCPAFKYHKTLNILQRLIDEAFLQEWTSNKKLEIYVPEKYGYFPNPKKSRESFHSLFVLVVILCLSPISCVLLENILYDKNKKIKENMQLMGMNPLAYWLSWFIIEMYYVIFHMGLIAATLFSQDMLSLIPSILLFILMLGFGCSILLMCMTLTIVINKSAIANIVLLGILASSSFLSYFQNMNFFGNFFIRILAPVTFAQSSLLIFKEDYSMEMWIIFFEMFGIALFYAIICFLLDHLFPYEIYFPSCQMKRSSNSEEMYIPMFEEHYCTSEECLKLENIHKKYGCLGSEILDGVTVRIFRGEIVCLLGSNGAGKSTLMKILSTRMVPDYGNVTYSPNISIGVCPQENILLEDLSPFEQLSFFGQLKGISSSELDLEVTNLLRDFELLHCKDDNIKKLSLGEKRKLCLTLAMIGKPEVLLLDEPSSGMSIQSRSKLQNILRDFSDLGHSVVFTTHYLDEAELIADRIALLSHGKIQCCASSLFLKKNFGAGYNLKISLHEKTSGTVAVDLITSLTSTIEDVKIETHPMNKISIKLPTLNPVEAAEFLEKLEDSPENIKIISYSIESTTLEEVLSNMDFYGQLKRKNEDDSNGDDCQAELSTEEDIIQLLENKQNCFESFKILLYCRLLEFLRNPYNLFSMITPMLILIILCKTLPIFDSNFLEVNPSTYANRNIQIINLTGKPLNSLVNSFSKLNMQIIWKDKDEKNLEASIIKARMHKFEKRNNKLEVKCSWHFSLDDDLAIPVINNLMSNIIWRTIHTNDERILSLNIQPLAIDMSFSPWWDFRQIIFLSSAAVSLLYFVNISGSEIVEEREAENTSMIYRINKTCIPYWLSTLMAHFIRISFSLVAMFIIISIPTSTCIEGILTIPLVIVYMLSLPACLLWVYIIGRLFKTARSAHLMMPLVTFMIPGMIFLMMFAVILVFPDYDVSPMNTLFCLIYPLYIPHYIIIPLTKFQGEITDEDGEELSWNYLCCLIIPLSTFLLMSGLLFVEQTNDNLKRSYSKMKKSLSRESVPLLNLHNESEGINCNQKLITLKNVRKVYPVKTSCWRRKEKTVLQNLNLSFYKGEIFGLMGGNGAGKSSLLKLLADIERSTSGEIALRNKNKISISYCSEEYVLWSHLTVKEHLKLFALLHGHPQKLLNGLIERLLVDLEMEKYANKKASCISGGYRRKLSLAISLLGFAEVTILDEPTTGLDPESKRSLWERLHREFPQSSKRLLIFSSHSSEEVEANCSRIGLLADGSFKYLGTKEDLKNEFGKNIEMKINILESTNIEDFETLSSLLPQAVKEHKKKNTVSYYIPKDSFQQLSTLFRTVETIQNLPFVKDCFVSDVTLNQLFLDLIDSKGKITKDQEECVV